MARAVLTFHSIDDSGSVLSFPPLAFARLVERLVASGIPVVDFDELRKRDEGITFTFDDGMRSVHRHALPVLRHHGLPAHLFLTTGRIGKDMSWDSIGGGAVKFDMLDWREVEECARGGIEVEGHTMTHPDLRTLAPQRMVDECTGADDEIERHVGRRPKLFAFPFGLFDETVRCTLAPHYAGCFSTRLGYFGDSADLSRIPRLDTYFLRAPQWYERPFATVTRGYIGLRALIRAVRGKR